MDYFNRAKRFRTKKRLGQNFLVDENVIDFIVEQADLTKEDTVIEIGAGIGFVTEQLVKYAGKVIAIELDEQAIEQLKKIDTDNLEIIHQDILKTDISELANGKKVKIVANIPYYITSPILAHLLGEIDDLDNKNRKSISEIILMVQEEVAIRMSANEKSPNKAYGLLTVLSQFWANCRILKQVKAKSFYPAPKVNSALVKLVVNDKPRLELSDYSYFRKTIRGGFSARRKNIKNALMNKGFDKDKILVALNNVGISENTRSESISIEDFGRLSEELCKLK